MTQPNDGAFRIIETMRGGADGLVHLDRHLARLRRSCAAFDIQLNAPLLDDLLASIPPNGLRRVRFTVDLNGHIDMICPEVAPITGPWTVALSPTRLNSADPWLQIKTTNRALYDTARASLPATIDEWIFENEHGALCEGTITNIFVQKDGQLLTPPRTNGLLPGILRETLLAQGAAQEAQLRPDDLLQAEAFFVGNSLRGLIPAVLR
ncbi:hypothetical protein BFP70_06240 [Thioclava sp. SK-1]|uniref:aminotransferase class IV n=1 Tax=Thioclava sp. SK-1 TaxID=1889770 RepID=UPI000825A0C7|nr:aminotransferase class IV [Thioclava sp. SK-1]OCX65742.1 hypothetical protein BFP70_06240 [Thioclava sp. SK-1]